VNAKSNLLTSFEIAVDCDSLFELI